MDHNLINKLEGMRRVLDDIRLKRNYLWTKIDKYKRDKRRNLNSPKAECELAMLQERLDVYENLIDKHKEHEAQLAKLIDDSGFNSRTIGDYRVGRM
jgi:hypothetical protein